MTQQVWKPDPETFDVEIARRVARAAEILAPYGSFSGDPRDLKLIQIAIDEPALPVDDVVGWQCLGMAFGSILTHVLPLRWVMVDDEYGRDPALQYAETSTLLFPLTMISKRIERGDPPDIQELFRIICADLKTRQRDEQEPPS